MRPEPRDFRGKRYWLIGASSGLGAALARQLDDAGAALVLSARDGKALNELARSLKTATPLRLDVTDRAAVDTACAGLGPVDGVIYCAGAYTPLHARDWDRAAVDQMMQVNLMGALDVMAHVVPAMLDRGTGHIVLVSSLSAYRGLPGSIGYSASKAGLTSLGESLYADLHSTGIDVQIVSPGFIDTRLTRKNDFDMVQIMSPEQAAMHVMRAMRGRRLNTAFPRPFSLFFTLGRFLPARWHYRLMGS